MESRTFTENGDFLKAKEFELMWADENVKKLHNATNILSDGEYLDYKLWEDIYFDKLYKKHLPNTIVFRGQNPNIIFHGGCLGCLSQRINGLERCKDCRYFRFDWNKQDLHIKGEECSKMSADDINKFLDGK